MACESRRLWSVETQGFLFPVDFEAANITDVSTQILQQLVDEDRALVDGSLVIVPHHEAANLADDERSTLGLPEAFPFVIEIRSIGNLGNPDFTCVYRFLDGNGHPFSNPKRTGALLEIGSELVFLLVGDQYRLLEAIDAFSGREQVPPGEAVKSNLLVFARVKGLAQATGAMLDMYLNEEQVIAPSKIRVQLRRVDQDTIEVEPVLCEEKGGTAGQTEMTPLLDARQQEGFIRVFDKFLTVREIYPVPSGPRVVLDEPVKEALEPFKSFRRVSGREKEFLLNNPQEFFDPEVVDLDQFSERVIEIGEYKPRVFPFLRPAREPWLPPEGGVVIGDVRLPLSPDEATKLRQSVQDALDSGRAEVDWQGERIRADGELVKALDEFVDLAPTADMSSQEVLDRYQQRPRSMKVLIIKDNFSEATYSVSDHLRPGKPGQPRSLKPGVRLLPHQQEGLEWLQRVWVRGAKGALLADDMGLGKTLQSLAFMAWVTELMDDGLVPRQPMLIVAPVVLLETWKQEYHRFLNPVFGPMIELHGPGLGRFKTQVEPEITGTILENGGATVSRRRNVLDHEALGKAGAVLTTYETLRDYQLSLGRVDWAAMVLDESQKIKTPGALVTLAAKAMKYEFGLCLTGTPVENSLVDLWSIIDFASPGKLDTLREFTARYQNPLNHTETDRWALGQELKAKIGDLMKRRLKEDYLEGLPAKEVHTYPVEMPHLQLQRYLEVVHRARNGSSGSGGKRRKHIFETIAALRDVSLHPYLVFTDQGLAELPDKEIISASARLSKTIEILEAIRKKGEKAIVFVLSRKMQRAMQRILLNRFGVRSAIVNGEVTGGRRQQLVDDFQKSKGFNAIIMSPEAAGLGLNITAANHVIHLSRPWNPAKEDQATDRVYRIGQKRSVHVHIPLAVHPVLGDGPGLGSFDQKLHRLLADKRELSRSVLMPSVVEESEWQRLGEEILTAEYPWDDQLEKITISFLDRTTPDLFEHGSGK